MALLAALRKRGISVRAAKTGPDYIDAGWLTLASGSPCLNLDCWMSQDKDVLAHLSADYADYLVVEGAMGLYDGGWASSSGRLAVQFGLPVVLVINARGMAESSVPLVQGFLSFDPEDWPERPRFCGIICANTGSSRHETLLARALEPVCAKFEVPLLGFLPRAGAPQLPSRHLGLVQAVEQSLDLDRLASWFSANCDCELILARTFSGASSRPVPVRKPSTTPTTTIAIASDEAFQFCYADLPEMLQDLGARIEWFSPVRDSKLPVCAGIYLPGGYPELYARELAGNMPMLDAIRKHAASGLPVYGECGGFIYLLERLFQADGSCFPMLGLLRGSVRMKERCVALGYRRAIPLWLSDQEVRGHEFHYAAESGADAAPLWQLQDSAGVRLGPAGARHGNIAGSWLHLYPAGSRDFWRRWVGLCREMAMQ